MERGRDVRRNGLLEGRVDASWKNRSAVDSLVADVRGGCGG